LRASFVGNLFPTGGEDSGDFFERACQKEIRLRLRERFLKGLPRIPKCGETNAEGETEKLVRP
jgi:hypothetical protein